MPDAGNCDARHERRTGREAGAARAEGDGRARVAVGGRAVKLGTRRLDPRRVPVAVTAGVSSPGRVGVASTPRTAGGPPRGTGHVGRR
jgi:hypothetical protein